MGQRQSKGTVLSYEDARQRVGPEIEQRLRDAFKRYANSHQLLHRVFFFREVLGDVIPERIAEEIYKAFGGGPNGVSFKDLVVGLALLTLSNDEEKAKFLFSLFSNDSEMIEKRSMDQLLVEIEGSPSSHVTFLFRQRDRVTFEEFNLWIKSSPDATSFSTWLMRERMALTDNVETKTFYSTLVDVTHLEENEITQLEQRFWQLKPPSGRIDTGVFMARVGDLLPEPVVNGLFRAFDVNGDAQIDFKEMTCGVSACCRGPDCEREKFVFKIFDADGNGFLDRDGLAVMLAEFQRAWTVNDVCAPYLGVTQREFAVDDLLASALPDPQQRLSMEDYRLWIAEPGPRHGLSAAFVDLLSQICHVIFGLPPKDAQEERRVVLHWLKRETKNGLLKKDRRFFLLARDWWSRWNDYVCFKSGQAINAPFPGEAGRPTLATDALTDGLGPGARRLTHKSSSLNNLSNGANEELQSPRPGAPPGLPSSSSANFAMRNMLRQESVPAKEPRNGPKQDRRRTVAAEAPPKEPGPIDNGSLVTHFKAAHGRLQTITDEGDTVRRDVREGEDFVVLPERLWEALHRRYNGGPPLPRMVVTGSNGALQLELHPIMVRILRHQTLPERPPGAGGNAGGGKGLTETARYLPQAGAFWSVGGHAPTAPGNGLVNTPRRRPVHLAFFSAVHTLAQIYTFLGTKLRVAREEMRLWLYVDEARMTLLEDEETDFGRAAEQVHFGSGMRDVVYDGRTPPLNLLLEVRNSDLTWPEEIYQLTKTGLLHSRRTSLVLGVTGLNNLGNTCFLNAAVQCVSNTGALRRYFEDGFYNFELNKQNPLGMKGHIAHRYGELLLDLWSGSTCVVAPLKLRMTIAKYSSQFSGNMQHDSHEFLAFLLDGLHEDLNRVVVKPYVELKDSDGRDDAVVAKEAWDNHLLRNRSVVVDLFHGLLKSQVTCCTCANVSVRFDPFSVLSLPLPMESSQPIDVIVSRLDESQLVRYRLLLNHDDRFRAVKVELARHYSGVTPDRILLAEVLNSQIRCFPRDGEKVNRLTISSVYAYIFPPEPELPTANDARADACPSEASPQRGPEEEVSPPSAPITRNSSAGSLTALGGDQPCNFDCFVAYHRKMERSDVYFLAHMKARPRLFGLPIVIPYPNASVPTGDSLYRAVWTQVKRLMGPKSNESLFFSNHATDCDDNANDPFPFQLKIVDRMGMKCPCCDWWKLCRGCTVPCRPVALSSDQTLARWLTGAGPAGARYLAIDWEPTALHLRYQSSREYEFVEHASVADAERRLTEPMDLRTCLDHFVHQEELGEEDCYYCSKCGAHRRAKKKLDLWKVPPILIVHLKRFHFVNNRWMKSHKIVNFPRRHLDLSPYVVSGGDHDLSSVPNGSVDPAPANAEEPDVEKEDEEAAGKETPNAGKKEAERPPHLYQLYAIVCHLGALGGGHYVAYARNPNQRWYRFNDSSTKEVTEAEIDVNSAYMLFYERENTNWSDFMPSVNGRAKVNLDDDDDIDSDIRRVCSLM